MGQIYKYTQWFFVKRNNFCVSLAFNNKNKTNKIKIKKITKNAKFTPNECRKNQKHHNSQVFTKSLRSECYTYGIFLVSEFLIAKQSDGWTDK